MDKVTFLSLIESLIPFTSLLCNNGSPQNEMYVVLSR